MSRGSRARARPSGRVWALTGFVALACLALLLFVSTAFAAAPAFEPILVHGPTNVSPTRPAQDQVMSLAISARIGKISLRFENEETGEEGETSSFSVTAEASVVREKLEKLKAIGTGNVEVEGGPGDAAGSKPYLIRFVGQLAGRNLGEEALEVAEEEVTEAEEKKLVKELVAGGTPAEEAEEIASEQEGNVSLTLATAGFHNFVDYRLVPRNLGATAAGGSQIKATLKLPAGLTTRTLPSPGSQLWICVGASTAQKKLNKQAKLPEDAGMQEVVCTTEKPINPDGEGGALIVEAFVDASALTEGHSLLAEATLGGGGAPTVTVPDAATVSSAAAPFGVQTFKAAAFGENGELATQAAGHPYAATTSFFFNTTLQTSHSGVAVVQPPGNIKDVDVKLPAGFVGNPQATPRCPQSEFTESLPGSPHKNGQGVSCRPETEVGVANIYLSEFDKRQTVAVYNLLPPPGVPAEFGLIFANVPIRLDAHVVREPSAGSEPGEYRVTVLSPNTNEIKPIFGVSLSLWGVPADESHKAERFIKQEETGAPSADAGNPKPFLTNPSDCLTQLAQPPLTSMYTDSWQSPGALDSHGDPILSDPHWGQSTAQSPSVKGCDALAFSPAISFSPANAQADAPSGFDFGLSVPQNESPTGRATPDLKDTTVTLPEGVTISPSAANGLQACTDEQINLDSIDRGACPDASQVGTVKIKSPLLEKELEGRVYIGSPRCSPCSNQDAEAGNIFRLFIEAEGSGVRVKLPGTTAANPDTGQLTARFRNNPQLPFETLTLSLTNGPRAPLATPQSCSALTTTASLIPWSIGGTFDGEIVPGTPPATSSYTAPSQVSFDGLGGGCPATAPFAPGFAAGTEGSQAGAYSPFDVTFTRQDREQDLSGITVSTPPGLLGKIAGIPRCPEAQANAGSCSEASRIATATSAAGAGPSPYVVSGPVFLTDGYKGAPFGLSIVVPAVAGPFNLGTVVVRAAISINPQTSALSITSDPLPQKMDGVPFRLKTVKVRVDRPQFMFNPTNCETQSVGSTLTGAPVKAGEPAETARRSAPFTASGCAALPFHPVLTATTAGKTSKAGGASLDVKLSQKGGEANIHKVTLQLPIPLPSRLTTIQKACTEKQFGENPAGCPEGSNVGSATARTPLLSAPLQGPAYLVSHGGAAFPDLVFLLQGEGVHIELVGHTDIKKGITYSRFETVPDAPISFFETVLPQGPHSALAANGNLCEQSLIAPTTIVGQNNAQIKQETKIGVTGCTPSVSISGTKVRGNSIVVKIKLTVAGNVRLSGRGLKTVTKRGLGIGAHTVSVRLGKAGKAAKRHHRHLRVKATLTAAGKTVSKTVKVRA